MAQQYSQVLCQDDPRRCCRFEHTYLAPVEAILSEYFDRDDRKYTSVYKQETPDILAAFAQFDNAVFAAEGREIPLKYRELIALAVATTTQCVYCIEAHATKAVAAGASDTELAEASWVATALRAGGGFAHGRLAFKFGEEARGHQH